jgi:gliding motility-associated-like protein
MVVLNPVEQNISDITIFQSNRQSITKYYANILIKTIATSTLTIEGALPGEAWQAIAAMPGYSYIKHDFGAPGRYRIKADSGFNAICYGFGSVESYAYSAGTNVKDLYQQIGVHTQYGVEVSPSVCTNTPFQFKVSLPYCADSLIWDLSGLPSPPANPPTQIYTTCIPGPGGPDSNTTVNTKTLYWYSLPAQYSIATVGSYPINILAYSHTNTDGCGNEQSIDFDLGVSDPPVANFSIVAPGCVADSASFLETTSQTPKPTYHYWWDFGEPSSGLNNTSSIKNPKHLYSTPGTYTVRFSDITTPGCLSDTISKPVIVPPMPTATISGTLAVCVNGSSPTITFTGTDGAPPYTFTYNINGGPSLTVGSIGVSTTATVSAPTGTAGTFIYNLMSVQNTGSIVCVQAQSGSATVTVNPLPTAAISGTTAVCVNAPSPNITFTGGAGTAPYTFTYTINGGGPQTVTTTVGNSVTVPVSTTVAGTFIYTLQNVQDASSTTCSQLQAGSATVIVNPLPTASVSGSTTVCLNAAAPSVTFTGASGTAPYTFTYNINGGPNQTITTVAGNSVNLAAPTNVAGTFTYTLISVQDGSATTCSQNQSGSVVITVNPIPTATIAGTITVCLNAASPNITFTGASGTAPYTFTYNINGGASQTITTSAGNSITLGVPTNIAGTFVYNLVSVQDGSSAACNQAQSGSATIIVSPLPTAGVSGTAAVCLNAASPNITFTGANGTAPYTFTYNINGGPNQTVNTVAGNSVTVAAPTNVAGTFTYNLISVQESSSNACSQSQPGSATITVNPLPTAAISGTTTVCRNSASPNVTFTGASGTSPYTFTYNINGGPNQVVTTSVGNSVNVPAATGTVGVFTYTLVSVQDGSSTTCSQNQGGSVVITVNPLPTASISGSASVCVNSPSPNITFTGAGTTSPYTFTYNINGGPNQTITTIVGNSITLAVPTTTAGVFNYNLVSVQDASSTTCSQAQAGVATITVNQTPTAAISGNATVCLNASSPNVTFTGSFGTPPYTFTYNINGGANQTVSTVAGNSVNVPAPTNVVGTFIYNLVSVSDGSATACTQAQSGSATITVNPLPTAAIAGTITVCLNAASPNITFTGASATAPYTFTYNINGGGNQTITTVAGNSITLAVPTNVAGTFIYNLVSVQEASSAACTQAQSGSATVIVKPLPTASISGATSVCQNAATPNITFTGASGTPPYTFTYNINGGGNLTVSSGASNTATVSVPTATPGTYTYTLVSVQEGSANTCNQPQGGSAVVTVNPSPTASISGTVDVCRNGTSPDVTFTGIIGTPPFTFTYNINGGPNQTITTVAGNSVTIAAPTNVAGVFTYNLVSVQDGSVTACSQTQSGSTVITVNDLPSVNFNYSAPNCQSKDITFTDASVPNSGVLSTWTWDFGDANNGSGTPIVHQYANTGVYNVSLSVTNSKGCVNNTTRSVTVSLNPQAGFKVPAICLNDVAAVFEDTSKIAAPGVLNFAQFWWNFGDPASGAANTQFAVNGTHTFSNVGNFIVTHVAISSTGCTDTVRHNVFVNGSNPIANFAVNNAANLCANDSVAITNQSIVAPGNITKVEIYWDNVNFPGGPPEADNSPTPGKIYKHLYPNFQAPLTKNFNIRFLAYSGIICVNEITKTITVHAAPKVQFNPIPDACFLVAPYQITQASEVGGVPGSGTFSGPGVSSSGVFNPQVAGFGTHTIKYTYTSTSGCVDTLSQTITVRDTATALFTFNAPVCEHTDVTFTDQSTSPSGVVLANTVWNFGDGSPTENHTPGSSFTHVFPAANTYNVSMYNVSDYGCRSTTTTLSVAISPLPKTMFTVDKANYCLPDALVKFDASTSTIADGTENQFTYQWDFADPGSGVNNNSVAKAPSHIYTSVGPFNVTLTITSGVGCPHDTMIPISTIHPQPKARFTTDRPSTCILGNVLFTDNTDPIDGSTIAWDWKLGDGSVQNTSSFSYTYLSADTFHVKLFITTSKGCNSDTADVEFPVYNYPTVNAGTDAFILEGGTITLNPTVTGQDLQFLWTPILYLDNNTIEKPKVTDPKTDITYKLTVTGIGGCKKSDDVFIKVLRFPKIPNTFTPNGDFNNDTWIIGYLNTYPDNRVQVFNRQGQVMFESHGYNVPWDGTYKGKPLPVDTYYYIIEPGNGREPIKGFVTIMK